MYRTGLRLTRAESYEQREERESFLHSTNQFAMQRYTFFLIYAKKVVSLRPIFRMTYSFSPFMGIAYVREKQ